MWRTFLAVVAGLVTWAVVVTILNIGLRAAIPGYHAAEATLQFTMAMKIGRLTEAALTSLVAGVAVGLTDPSRKWTPWLAGAIVLAIFLPVHVKLWSMFPAWYHLTFLIPIAPLFALGTRMATRGAQRQPELA